MSTYKKAYIAGGCFGEWKICSETGPVSKTQKWDIKVVQTNIPPIAIIPGMPRGLN